MLKVEIREDLAAFDELAPWWNDQPGPRQSVFLRSEWFRTLAETTLSSGDRLHVMVVRDDEDPLAAVPMYSSGGRLKALTELATESFDVIHSGDERGIKTAMSELSRESYVRFTTVLPGSPILGETESNPRWHVDQLTESAHIDMRGGPARVVSGFSRNMRKNLRRGLRALQEMGELGFELHTERRQVSEAFQAALALEAAGWKGREGASVLGNPRRQRFFEKFTRLAHDHGWLRLGTMSLDGVMIAFSYDILYAGRLAGILSSYDESLPRKCSPGNVLLWKTVERAADQGARAVDLGGASGRNSWKLQWMSATTTRCSVTGFGSGAIGRAAHLVWRIRRSRSGSSDTRGVPADD